MFIQPGDNVIIRIDYSYRVRTMFIQPGEDVLKEDNHDLNEAFNHEEN